MRTVHAGGNACVVKKAPPRVKAVSFTTTMKKNLAEMHIFNVVTVMSRIARELRHLCAGSADRLAEILDVIVLSGGRFEPAVAWAKAIGAVEDEGPYGEQEHFAHDSGVRWEDRYAYCSISEKENIVDMDFTTSGGHGLRIVVELPVYDASNDAEKPGSIEVIADGLTSSRFWADDDDDGQNDGLTWDVDTQRLRPLEDGEAPARVVANRESAFLKALTVDDVEFADREAAARLAQKADFERRIAETSQAHHADTDRRRAAAKAAKAAIEAIKANKAAAEA